MYDKLNKVGINPKINIMDNEASSQVCHFITNTLHASHQKVAPHCHKANAKEKPFKPPNIILLHVLHPLTCISPCLICSNQQE